jgi:hypothetical protein
MDDLIILIFIGFIFGVIVLFGWYFIHRTKLKERILLSEKGIDISTLIPPKKTKDNLWLKIGIVLISGSSGLLFGMIFDSLKIFGKYYSNEPVFLIFLFLFSGIGMVIAHYADISREQN